MPKCHTKLNNGNLIYLRKKYSLSLNTICSLTEFHQIVLSDIMIFRLSLNPILINPIDVYVVVDILFDSGIHLSHVCL